MFSSEKSFWEFSLSFYGKPLIADCCLQLQDTYNADVNILLWAIWLEQRQIRLSEERLTAARETVEAWNNRYIQVLRNLRRSMKREFPQSLEQVAPTRNLIKQAELAAEKQEQKWLETMAARWNAEVTALTSGENIAMYLSNLKVPLATIEQIKSILLGK